MTTAGICLPCLRPIVDIRPSGQGTVSNCKGLFHWQLIELNVHVDLILLLLLFNLHHVTYTAISRKVVGKNVHATIPNGNMY